MTGPAERACFQLQVRPERLADYVQAHRHVWSDMLAACHFVDPGVGPVRLPEVFHLADQLAGRAPDEPPAGDTPPG